MNVNVRQLEKDLLVYTAQTGGHEKRHYLGMSNISAPEEVLLRNLIEGTPEVSQQDAQRLAMGYVVEDAMRKRLEALGVLKPNSQRKLVASFDSRFQGHVDGELTDGSLLEIKSTTEEKLKKIIDGHLPRAHYRQIQMYLHWGAYPQCIAIYIARDTGRLHLRRVQLNHTAVEDLNNKARSVLFQFDQYRRNHQSK